MVYLDLNKKYVEKHMKSMSEEALNEWSDEGKDKLRYVEDTEDIEVEIDNNNVNINSTTPIGFISLDVNLTDEQIFELVEYLRTKANKVKRLINLADEE